MLTTFQKASSAPAKPFRMALGALIIKEKLGISDSPSETLRERETVEQIKETPYLQYFIGQEYYSNEEPFDASMMVHFRKRIGASLIHKVNRKMIKEAREDEEEQRAPKKSKEQCQAGNRGKLLLDATVGVADITYPRLCWVIK